MWVLPLGLTLWGPSRSVSAGEQGLQHICSSWASLVLPQIPQEANGGGV